MVSEKTLTIIIVCCVIAVAVAAFIKIDELAVYIPEPISTMIGYEKKIEKPMMDSSFFEQESVSEIVHTKTKKQETISSYVDPLRIPGVTAVSYLIGNASNGNIFLEYNSRRVMPVASMSKLVTAFVATDMLALSSKIHITESASYAPPDRSGLVADEYFSLENIMFPLLLSSSNIAAEAISSSTGNRQEFMEMMRSYSWEVGMPNSFFADPSGVSPQNVATARDIFALAKYLLNYRPDILTITRIATTSLATTTEHNSHNIENTHPFVTDSRFIGGKTGRTPEAGETMVTIMNIKEQPIAIVVLGSRNRENDTRILIDKIEAELTQQASSI